MSIVLFTYLITLIHNLLFTNKNLFINFLPCSFNILIKCFIFLHYIFQFDNLLPLPVKAVAVCPLLLLFGEFGCNGTGPNSSAGIGKTQLKNDPINLK